MNKILEYDLFIFDFDGTILNTEPFHCKSWEKALSEYKKTDIKFSMHEYQKYFHTLNENNGKTILKLLYGINDYNKIYEMKQHHYAHFVKHNEFNFIEGAMDFLKFLIKNGKRFIIVSNTSNKFIEVFKEKHPILNYAEKIYTKEYFLNRKPNPECYLKISNEYHELKKIGFEDSLVGIQALYQVNEITPVLLYDINYYHMKDMIKTYDKAIILEKYNMNDLEYKLQNYKYKTNNINFINKILNNNIEQLNKNFLNMSIIINQITVLINNLQDKNHIYLSGMGKSGYVCKKSASTWQSLSIKCSYIDLPNLPHGDFGIFNDNDILILISNSGNTDEIIYILEYIRFILDIY
jgi:beta-phosphoglucomutase-like phosphatase (HAD superfamily)